METELGAMKENMARLEDDLARAAREKRGGGLLGFLIVHMDILRSEDLTDHFPVKH